MYLIAYVVIPGQQNECHPRSKRSVREPSDCCESVTLRPPLVNGAILVRTQQNAVKEEAPTVPSVRQMLTFYYCTNE